METPLRPQGMIAKNGDRLSRVMLSAHKRLLKALKSILKSFSSIYTDSADDLSI